MAQNGHRAGGDARISRARYNRIMRFATGVMIQTWWFDLVLPRIGLRTLSARGRTERARRVAQRFRAVAVDLGGLMIKVGQFLSSRLDVLPPEVTAELEQLQDDVPAVPFDTGIRPLAEAELGVALERAYAWFDPEPVAAASFGQAHRARLSDEDAALAGFTDVIVKVQRPGIADLVATDLAALRSIAARLSRFGAIASRVDAPAIVEEFATTSGEELDYLHEGVSAERFAEIFADDDRVAAPTIVWERTTRRVVTLSDVTAIKITDVDALVAAGIDPVEVAQTFADVMFEQLFGAGFFHADPHPGNVFVTPRPAGEGGRAWTLTFIDFGMMGAVPDGVRKGLQALVIAVAARDGKGLTAAIQQIGVLLPGADTTQLEHALTALFSRFGGVAFGELQSVDPREFRDFADEFGEAMRTLPIQLPESFLLITRAVSLTSGVCSALDPAFNMWHAVEPYSQRLLREEGANVLADAARQALTYAKTVVTLPQHLDAMATRVEAGTLAVDTPQINRRIDRLEALLRRTIAAVICGVMVIGGALLHAWLPAVAIVLVIAAVLPLGYALFARGGQTERNPRRRAAHGRIRR